MKTCVKCKQEKEDNQFYKSKENSCGLKSYCILCDKASRKSNYHRNKSRHREITRGYRIRNRKFIIEHLLKNSCIDCGESDLVVLDFDHIQDKHFGISKMVNNKFSIKNLKKEMKKCEVRCANCHRRKTAKNQNWMKILSKPESI